MQIRSETGPQLVSKLDIFFKKKRNKYIFILAVLLFSLHNKEIIFKILSNGR